MKKRLFPFTAGLLLLTACDKEEKDQSETVFKASGNITAMVAAFKAALGPLNTAPGATGGHREINWDGVPDSLLEVALPGDFFNPIGAGAPAARQRGLAYNSTEFQVSNNGFAKLNAGASAAFAAFSGDKVFANVISRSWPVGFQLAGEATPAAVKAFGAVFADVDVEGSVTIELFHEGQSLGVYTVPPHDQSTPFSFLGIQLQESKITKVQVRHQGLLSDGAQDVSQGGTEDLIVVDDLIYSEPVEVIE